MKDERRVEILLIGGSAGSISVLMKVLPHLRPDLPFPILAIIHRKSHPGSMLEELLGLHCRLPVEEAYDKMTLENGHIYVVPADYHLLFENKTLVSLDCSEKVNYSRPSIDVTFESAAPVFQGKTAALLLSGANADGLRGMQYIHRQGGRVFVQNPQTAEMGYMPQQVLLNMHVEAVLKVDEMAFFINQLHT